MKTMQAVKSRKATILDNMAAIIALESLVDGISSGGATNEEVLIINNRIKAIEETLKSNDVNLDSLQEIVDYSKVVRAELEDLGIKGIAGLEAALGQKETKLFVDNMKIKFDKEISDINATLESDDNGLDSFQKIVTFIKENRTLLESLTVSNVEGLDEALGTKALKIHEHTTDQLTYKGGNVTKAVGDIDNSSKEDKTTDDIKHGEGTLAEKITSMQAETAAIESGAKSKADKDLAGLKADVTTKIGSAKAEMNTYSDEEFEKVASTVKSDTNTKIAGMVTVKDAEIIASGNKMKEYTAEKVPVMEQEVKTDADTKAAKRATANSTETKRVDTELASAETERDNILGASVVPEYDPAKHKEGDIVMKDGEMIMITG